MKYWPGGVLHLKHAYHAILNEGLKAFNLPMGIISQRGRVLFTACSFTSAERYLSWYGV